MKRFILPILIICLTFFTGCNKGTKSNNYTSNDSLFTYKEIVKIHIESPDLALERIDTAEMRRCISQDTCTLLRIIVYSLNDTNKAIDLGEHFISNTTLDHHDPLYLWILRGLSDNYRTKLKYEQSLKYSIEGAQLAHEVNDVKSETDFNFNAGNCMVNMGDNRGFEYIDAAINLLQKDSDKKNWIYLSFYIGQKSRLLSNQGRYKEAAETCRSRIEVIERIKKYRNTPVGYIDEQYGRTLSVMAFCLAKDGNWKEAEETAQKFYETSFSNTPNGLMDIQYYEREMKHGQRLINICNRLEPLYQKGDTINIYYTAYLDNLAEGYRLTGRYNLADAVMIRMDIVKDSIINRERISKTIEMGELYHTQEKEFALLKEQENLKKSQLITVLLIVVLIIVGFFFWIIFRYYQISKKKNRILVQRINQLIDRHKEIRQIKLSQSKKKKNEEIQSQLTIPETGAKFLEIDLKKTDDTFIKDSVPTEKISNTMMNNSEATVNSETTDISLDTPKGKKGKHTSSTQCNLGLAALFEKLENLMNEKQIYKDQNLNRESIMQFLNVNRNQLAQMMAENTNGLSISSYINEYRIQNACDMIRNNHNVSMQEVCIECGFSSVRTFNRLFKQQLSITPLEYKAAL